MVENNKYMLLSMSVIIHKLVCDWLLRLPPPDYLQYFTTLIGYIFVRGCASRSP